MTSTRPKNVDSLSLVSLLVEPRANGLALGTATAFCVARGACTFLVTNWHVFAGRHPDTLVPLHASGAVPDSLALFHHSTSRLGDWVLREESLVAPSGAPSWLEHPLKNKIDVAALPLSRLESDVRIHPLDLSLADFDVTVQVAMAASIIGFPFGLATSGVFPIWKTGHIATDPDLDYQNTPCFLIDATTREGMSGSPVLLRQYGPYSSSIAALVVGAGPATRFLGVYSGRIHNTAEIGRVWKPDALRQLFASAGV